jgi:hypothetical protein
LESNIFETTIKLEVVTIREDDIELVMVYDVESVVENDVVLVVVADDVVKIADTGKVTIADAVLERVIFDASDCNLRNTLSSLICLLNSKN